MSDAPVGERVRTRRMTVALPRAGVILSFVEETGAGAPRIGVRWENKRKEPAGEVLGVHLDADDAAEEVVDFVARAARALKPLIAVAWRLHGPDTAASAGATEGAA